MLQASELAISARNRVNNKYFIGIPEDKYLKKRNNFDKAFYNRSNTTSSRIILHIFHCRGDSVGAREGSRSFMNSRLRI